MTSKNKEKCPFEKKDESISTKSGNLVQVKHIHDTFALYVKFLTTKVHMDYKHVNVVLATCIGATDVIIISLVINLFIPHASVSHLPCPCGATMLYCRATWTGMTKRVRSKIFLV
jgi:hypothetical protein